MRFFSFYPDKSNNHSCVICKYMFTNVIFDVISKSVVRIELASIKNGQTCIWTQKNRVFTYRHLVFDNNKTPPSISSKKFSKIALLPFFWKHLIRFCIWYETRLQKIHNGRTFFTIFRLFKTMYAVLFNLFAKSKIIYATYFLRMLCSKTMNEGLQ